MYLILDYDFRSNQIHISNTIGIYCGKYMSSATFIVKKQMFKVEMFNTMVYSANNIHQRASLINTKI